MNYKVAAEKAENYIIEQRRWFHQHPELSWKEFQTTDKIVEELTKLGYEVHRFEGVPGCWCVLEGGKAAEGCKMVALRADIDALPVTENTGLPFASENPGVMHACGHDGHISMLLGAAKILMETQEELCGKVKFIFQPSEENCHGASVLINQGIMDGVDVVMGMHIWGTLDAPYMNFQAGPRMACADIFSITVKGQSTHGTSPQLGADALVAACAIIMNLQTLVSRTNDPLNPLVVTMGEMHAGQRFNIIADHAVMHGSVRTYDNEFRKKAEATILRIAQSTAESFGCTAELDYEYTVGPVINDKEVTAMARKTVEKLFGPEKLREMPMLLGSDDFANYMQKAPGVYGYIGSRDEASGCTATNHNDHYTVLEEQLKEGAAVYAQFAADYLEENK